MFAQFTDRPTYDYYFNDIRETLIGVRKVYADNRLIFNQLWAYIARRGITHSETLYDRPSLINIIDYATTVGYKDSSPHPPAAWNWGNVNLPNRSRIVRRDYSDERDHFFDGPISKIQNAQPQQSLSITITF